MDQAIASAQPTIHGIVETVLPNGTRGTRQWGDVCEWPPDLFAVVAAITERSGLYSEQSFMSFWTDDFLLKDAWIDAVRAAGEAWALHGSPPPVVQTLWHELLTVHRNARVDDRSYGSGWKEIVLRLMVIADEASASIGFPPDPNDKDEKNTLVQRLFMDAHIAWVMKLADDAEATGGDVLPYLPHSLCIQVPPAILCVQPKTSTPAVGCTLRSVTHNLALLPSSANVATYWYVASHGHRELDPFNVMVVPFPFSLPGRSFTSSPGHFPKIERDRIFRLDPDAWMGQATAEEFAAFLLRLIEIARPDLESVHAIVLPELALCRTFADDVAARLADRSGLDLFITGIVGATPTEARNQAAIYRFGGGKVHHSSFQSKHHRWRLEASQIRRYQLGHVLDPGCNWWEQICVSRRECHVTLFRPRASLAVLVCEDLARYDPVLTVMNAIGPNLVVALLMDGPQLEHRWSGRYATTLADDPGSAVLTVTSLGMVARSTLPGEPQSREIALWKEPDGLARALKLQKGDHALVLTLTSRRVVQYTLDGRSDGGAAVQFGLGAVHGIRHDAPPKWLGNVG